MNLGDPRCVAHLYYHGLRPRQDVRIEETATEQATQKRSRHKCVGIGKGVPRIDFLAALPFTARAIELSVERLQFLCLWIQFVLVSFYQFPRELWVHLLEGHVEIVSQVV